jgi:hypothetical protein
MVRKAACRSISGRYRKFSVCFVGMIRHSRGPGLAVRAGDDVALAGRRHEPPIPKRHVMQRVAAPGANGCHFPRGAAGSVGPTPAAATGLQQRHRTGHHPQAGCHHRTEHASSLPAAAAARRPRPWARSAVQAHSCRVANPTIAKPDGWSGLGGGWVRLACSRSRGMGGCFGYRFERRPLHGCEWLEGPEQAFTGSMHDPVRRMRVGDVEHVAPAVGV